MKLPTKWMECRWVEAFSSVKPAQPGGVTIYNTDAVDKPDLFLWIRENRFPQATSRDVHQALRSMCRDQLPGYKESPLNPELRKLLSDRIASIGKRLWSCQLAEMALQKSSAEPSPVLSSAKTDATNASEGMTSSSTAPTPSRAHSFPSASSYSSASADYFQNKFRSDSTIDAHQEVTDLPNTQSEEIRRYVTSLGLAGAPLGDAALHSGLVEFGFGREDVDVEERARQEQLQQQQQQHQQQQEQQRELQHHEFQQKQQHGQFQQHEQQQQQQQQQQNYDLTNIVQTSCGSFDFINTLLPCTMTKAHLAEFHQVTELLRHWQMDDIPAKYFTELEHHFTQCFSIPNAVSFIICETDRFTTGRADPYANQQAEQLFNIGLTQVQHIMMGIDSTRKASESLARAAQTNSVVAHVPRIWANTRDGFGNPCPRMVDMWLPRIIFNGTSFMVIVAPHGLVSLERDFEVLYAPGSTTFVDI